MENIIPNLVKLWSGDFKGLDTGTENYELPDEVWEEIWEETVAAMPNLPADFVRLLGKGFSYFTAEAWCFWFVFLAPVQLKGRLPTKYYNHACQLSNILKTCIQFVITLIQVAALKTDIIDWVRKYEQYVLYYYQFKEERLSACPLTVHGLLHVADDILFSGPSWTTWTFWMERYCGFLKASLRSKRHPWSNLNKNILHMAYLEQLGVRYDLEAELWDPNKLSGKSEYTFEGCKHSPYFILPFLPLDSDPQANLRLPYKRDYIPDDNIRMQVASYFALLVGKTRKEILPLLPQMMPSYGKLRIKDGDSIRSVSASRDGSTAERNMSFIRYETQTRRRVSEPWVSQIFYGRLERILVCNLPASKKLGFISNKTRLLAVITPCQNTAGKDAALVLTTYRGMGTPVVTDLQAVVAVVGRVQSRGTWTIIDRTGGLIRPEFVPDNVDTDSDDSED
ncbi:hypothetical protein GGX14DRAFT_367370 [Mycena pura]|uniref:Uncharacterized protein n=1 Tax=Mycena pura TaxID=153505 RepID=A0AAD6VB91_9AGAR|nr:hypothetical protein GGX14DRAFT_367370 [Mycena pura]